MQTQSVPSLKSVIPAELNFIEIKKRFDALNGDKSHFVNSNDICTPMECVKEMVDKIPATFWKRKNLKILDSCCGNGNFHAYIRTKTALGNLYFNEINEKRIKNVKAYFGEKIHCTNRDFLTFDSKEEYDLVISNPPYAKFDAHNKRVSKNHNLSRDFLRKALEITKPNGYIVFILPNNWMSFSDRNTLPSLLSKYQFIYLDINGAKKWFPQVGSSFTWFVLHKVPNTKPFRINNNYIIQDAQTATLDKGLPYIPLYYSETVRNILNKTVNNSALPKYNIETNSFLHRFTKKEHIRNHPDTTFCHRLIHTPKQTVWADIPHKFQTGYKVFLSLSDQYQTFVDCCGMTQSIAFIRCTSKKEAEKLKEDLNRPFYKFVNNLTRYGNFNNIRVLQHLPLWGTFKLTKKEEDFILLFNEKYYGKTKK